MSTPEPERSSPWTAGQNARQSGASIDENPHPTDSHERMLWLLGYETAGRSHDCCTRS